MSEEYDTSEYLITNKRKIFKGNALELITAMYKAEQLLVRVRLYAASKAAEFENPGGKSIEEIRTEIIAEMGGDDDGWKEKLTAEIERHRETIIEYRDLQLQAWVESGRLSAELAQEVRSFWTAEGDRPAPSFHIDNLAMPDLPLGPHTRRIPRISEITPAPQPPVVIRKRATPKIDPDDTPLIVDQTPTPPANVTETVASQPRESPASPPWQQSEPPAKQPGPSPQGSVWDDPAAPGRPVTGEIMVPTRAPGGGIRWVPR